MKATFNPVSLAALLAVGGLAAYVLWQRRAGESLAAAAGRAAAEAASDAVVGGVKGLGSAVGIPDTNPAECAAALARGDMLQASFLCPAADFLAGAWRNVATTIDSTKLLDIEPQRITTWSTQGGQWNNPSAYTAPSGQGGAAFGIYPRP